MSTHTYPATLVRIINADTLEVDLDLGLGLTSRQRLQLRGIDAPESDESGGADATAFVYECLTPAHDLTVTIHNQDAFGRWISDVAVAGASLNEALAAHLGTAFLV